MAFVSRTKTMHKGTKVSDEILKFCQMFDNTQSFDEKIECVMNAFDSMQLNINLLNKDREFGVAGVIAIFKAQTLIYLLNKEPTELEKHRQSVIDILNISSNIREKFMSKPI